MLQKIREGILNTLCLRIKKVHLKSYEFCHRVCIHLIGDHQRLRSAEQSAQGSVAQLYTLVSVSLPAGCIPLQINQRYSEWPAERRIHVQRATAEARHPARSPSGIVCQVLFRRRHCRTTGSPVQVQSQCAQDQSCQLALHVSRSRIYETRWHMLLQALQIQEGISDQRHLQSTGVWHPCARWS